MPPGRAHPVPGDPRPAIGGDGGHVGRCRGDGPDDDALEVEESVGPAISPHGQRRNPRGHLDIEGVWPVGVDRDRGRTGHLLGDPSGQRITVHPHEGVPISSSAIRSTCRRSAGSAPVTATSRVSGGRREADRPAEPEEHDDDEESDRPAPHPVRPHHGRPLGEALLGRLPRAAPPAHRPALIDAGPRAAAGPPG
uniref:Uncharacterized protein n=1 Tax=Janibacter limosus TaxID=53458 RepID=A0AC61U8N6_9MICO|nr:hypothetical protein [Janibacter limosus]